MTKDTNVTFSQKLGTGIGWSIPDYVRMKFLQRRDKAIKEKKKRIRRDKRSYQVMIENKALSVKRRAKRKVRRKMAKVSRRINRCK